MSTASFHLIVRSPFRTVFDGQVEAVHLKTDLGEMEVLPDHAELVGLVRFSRVLIKTGSELKEFILRQGSVSVEQDGEVRLLGLDVDSKETLNAESLQSLVTYLHGQLNGEHALNSYQRQFLEEQREALEEALTTIRA